jgi:hypothetical protein
MSLSVIYATSTKICVGLCPKVSCTEASLNPFAVSSLGSASFRAILWRRLVWQLPRTLQCQWLRGMVYSKSIAGQAGYFQPSRLLCWTWDGSWNGDVGAPPPFSLYPAHFPRVGSLFALTPRFPSFVMSSRQPPVVSWAPTDLGGSWFYLQCLSSFSSDSWEHPHWRWRVFPQRHHVSRR